MVRLTPILVESKKIAPAKLEHSAIFSLPDIFGRAARQAFSGTQNLIRRNSGVPRRVPINSCTSLPDGYRDLN